MTSIGWITIDATSEAVQISKTRLQSLQAAGKLKPGVHWVYLRGTSDGLVTWIPNVIKEWQVEETIRVMNSGKVHDIEMCSETNLIMRSDKKEIVLQNKNLYV
jgi:hypothetical protein